MPRTARIVVEGVPYHVTQRGNRRQDVFFDDEDRKQYLSYLADYSERYELLILGYCLMSNHTHIVSLPHRQDSLALTLRAVHMRYSQWINHKFRWTGHLWQGRYFSTALDDVHLWAAMRYVERNPVRAGIVLNAGEYRWSSAGFHLGLSDNKLIKSETRWGRPTDGWDDELALDEDEEMVELIRARTHSGFPCGSEVFVEQLSQKLGHPIAPLRGRGRPRKQ